ncbi:hypothetical protein [Streptomyces sp. NPDC004976]
MQTDADPEEHPERDQQEGAAQQAADLELDRAVELLHKAGHPDWAETVRTQVLGRNVIPGHWTFQIIEAYDTTYHQPFREIERGAVEELAEGRDHLYEAEMKEARRTVGHPDHTARPDTGGDGR